jgi:hypothetical protein
MRVRVRYSRPWCPLTAPRSRVVNGNLLLQNRLVMFRVPTPQYSYYCTYLLLAFAESIYLVMLTYCLVPSGISLPIEIAAERHLIISITPRETMWKTPINKTKRSFLILP